MVSVGGVLVHKYHAELNCVCRRFGGTELQSTELNGECRKFSGTDIECGVKWRV